MTSGATAQPTPEEAAELEAAIFRMIGEMNDLRALMQKDQAEIERLKAGSERLKAETEELKAEARLLKEASQTVQADTRRVLDALSAA